MKNKLLSKSYFHLILGCSALLIAFCAAFFSVYGIATLFAGAAISVIVMASSLEIGKLVGTTFLYRYWSKCNGFLKVYLIGAILTLMVITSAGIFGYLSAAFQKSSIEFGIAQEKITTTQEQKSYYHDKIDASKKRINDLITIRTSEENRMSEVLTNEYITRNPVQLKQLQQQNTDLINDTDNSIKTENDKIQDDINVISKIDSQINDLKMETAGKKDVQTFKFVADALKLPLDTVARWFILSIICVFDPLAICLILAYNVVVYKKEDESKEMLNTVNTPNIPLIEPKIEEIKMVEPPKIEEIKTETTVNTISTPILPKNNVSDFFKQMFKM